MLQKLESLFALARHEHAPQSIQGGAIPKRFASGLRQKSVLSPQARREQGVNVRLRRVHESLQSTGCISRHARHRFLYSKHMYHSLPLQRQNKCRWISSIAWPDPCIVWQHPFLCLNHQQDKPPKAARHNKAKRCTSWRFRQEASFQFVRSPKLPPLRIDFPPAKLQTPFNQRPQPGGFFPASSCQSVTCSTVSYHGSIAPISRSVPITIPLRNN